MLIVFSLYDLKTGAYSTPFFMNHPGEAMRACVDLATDRNTTVGRHPADFALHKIGTFDQSTGLLQPQQPESLGSVQSMLPVQPPLPMFNPDGMDRVIVPRRADDALARPNGRDHLEG